MTEAEFVERVRTILKLRELSLADSMGFTRGWDSLKHVSLVVALEDELGVTVPADRIGELTSIEALVEFFKNQGAIQ